MDFSRITHVAGLKNANGDRDGQRKHPKRRILARRPSIEVLEGRCLLASDIGATFEGVDRPLEGVVVASSQNTENGTAVASFSGEGIAIPEFRVGERGVEITIDIALAAPDTVLDAWIDFDGDGSFGGMHERIVATRSVSAGELSVLFESPATTASGTTKGLFRLATPSDTLIFDAEETVSINVLSPIEQPIVFTDFSEERILLDRSGNTHVLRAIDFDLDGDLDFLTGGDHVSLLEASGNGYIAHRLLDKSAHELNGLEVVDVDADGDYDLVTLGNRLNDPLAVHLNDGQLNFTKHVLAEAEEYVVQSLLVGDIDLDGDFDLLVSQYSDGVWSSSEDYFNGLVLYEQANQGWQRIELPESVWFTPQALGDLDGDGDLDLVATRASSAPDGQIHLFEYDGEFQAAILIADSLDRPGMAALADADGDSDIDIVVSTPDGLLLLNNQTEGFAQRNIIRETIAIHANEGLQLVDLTGDGVPEAVVNSDAVIRLSDGAKIGSTAGAGFFADVDQDGDLDTIDSDYNLDAIFWNEHVAQEIRVGTIWLGDDLREAAEQSTTFYARLNDQPPTAAAEPIQVEFTFEGDATFGEDFLVTGADEVTANGGYFTIAAGEVQSEFTINVLNDDRFELDEDLLVTIVENGEYAADTLPPIGKRPERTHAIEIIDDDPADFGDAPTRYEVGRSRNGAKHGAIGPMLGILRNAELDGTPSDDAVGEGAQDDGVTIGALQAGQQALVSVYVTGAGDGAYLDAWVDFNGDGHWSPVTDLVLSSVPVFDGLNPLAFNVPADVVPGKTFARFRLSSDGGHTPYGSARDGEVEDYAVDLASAPWGTGVFQLPEELPGEGAFSVSAVIPADIDQDGDPDLVVANQHSGLSWWSNDGRGSFATRTLIDDGLDDEIDANVYISRYLPSKIEAVDIDRDGDLDLITSGGYLQRPRIYFNTDGVFQYRSPRAYLGGEAQLVDIDRDGDPDLVAGADWLFSQGKGVFDQRTVTRYLFGNESRDFLQTIFYDIDGDGDDDAITLGEGGVRWFEGTGYEGQHHRFRYKSVVGFDAAGSRDSRLVLADFDQDSDLEVVVVGGNHPAIIIGIDANDKLTAEPSGERLWNSSVVLADLDADGDTDLAATQLADRRFGWFENQQEDGLHPIGLTAAIGEQLGVFPIDVDRDGDLDLVSWGYAGINGGTGVYLHKQVSNTVETIVSHAVVDEDDRQHVTFTVKRSGPLDHSITVPYTITGTAHANTDYTFLDPLIVRGTSGFLTLAVGEEEVSFRVASVADAEVESTESLIFTAGPGEDYIVGMTTSAKLLVIDDELADFGDAPSPYPTSRFENGARHHAIGPKLGALRSNEGDSAPGFPAPDDDGLAGHGIRVGARDAYLLVDVSGAPTGANLDAWIDFNGDGVWSGADEQVASNLTVYDGRNAVTFTTPADAKSGSTYARLRLSTSGGLGSLGAAPDGEVEDHRVTVGAPTKTNGAFGEVREADPGVFQWGNLLPYDLDGDGDLDFIEWKTSYSNWIARIENRGGEGMVRHPHDQLSTSSAPQEVAIGDLTGDGEPEVVVRTRSDLFVLDITAEGFIELAHARTDSSQGGGWVRLADVNSDGSLDVLLSTSLNNTDGLDAYRYSEAGELVGERLAEGVFTAASIADLNGDGRPDILATIRNGAGPYSVMPLYRQHNGSYREADAIESQGFDFTLTDFDSDGDIDIVYRSIKIGSIYYRVSWFENDGGGQFESQLLVSSLSKRADAFSLADYNGDGLTDVMVDWGETTPPTWHINLGDGEIGYGIKATNAHGLRHPQPADFDGDGDLDLIPGKAERNNLLWAPNLSYTPGDYSPDGVVDSDDLYRWRWSYSAADPHADGNGDGIVDAADYTVWRDHQGAVSVATDDTRQSLAERMASEQLSSASNYRSLGRSPYKPPVKDSDESKGADQSLQTSRLGVTEDLLRGSSAGYLATAVKERSLTLESFQSGTANDRRLLAEETRRFERLLAIDQALFFRSRLLPLVGESSEPSATSEELSMRLAEDVAKKSVQASDEELPVVRSGELELASLDAVFELRQTREPFGFAFND